MSDETLKIQKLIGRRIAAARGAARMSQVDLAAAIGVDPQTVSNWERGVRCPNGAYLYAMSAALNVSADFLVGNSDTLEVKS